MSKLYSDKLHILRRLSQLSFILLIALMPVFDILRYDSDTKSLIVLGNTWGLGLKEGFYADISLHGSSHVALQFFLKAILPWLGVLALFPLIGYITGRFFCGWLCPEGALFELSDFFTEKMLGRRSLFGGKTNVPVKTGADSSVTPKCRGNDLSKNTVFYSVIAILSILTISILGGIALSGYFVNPKTIWNQIASWNFTPGVNFRSFYLYTYNIDPCSTYTL